MLGWFDNMYSMFMDEMRDAVDSIKELMAFTSDPDISWNRPERYKPVYNIPPTKQRLFDRRPIAYHCRNNC